MYDNGEGVPQNYKLAAAWYRRAAEQGLAEAQDALGDMYYYGQGVTQNYIHAHSWYSLAAANGSLSAIEWRDDVAKFLTPSELIEAKSLALEYAANKFQTK